MNASAAVLTAREAIDRHARLVDDFPSPGIAFKDLTPVLADPGGLAAVVTALAECCDGAELIAGIDARGFLLGGAVARELGVGVVAVRKGGKLPPPVIGVDYDLEYGSARLEVPAEGIALAGRRVAVVDDVLATGGTLVAAARLLRQARAEVADLAVIMELAACGGRTVIGAGLGSSVRVHNLCHD
ncbi:MULTISPECIES: adenine phosphoribosyltransferase [unclassified Gordonia (in: high G+C Gram-positive bacteria)]|uniref:adenine phosphoribosyltransferase n=1 Tax=unclassified Gordonia (in: high G+C Gram-positive bacteria) TaxID=2657482 RepID=UPI001FFFC95C|nr:MULTISPECIES: adenine phosphoribosyltransferase [unclassified Gordonia (in: high G+C Gram-positive bacteria)]UQE73236.1 adenine phosphoribosyltransferase [Gordonia sp. PP30]